MAKLSYKFIYKILGPAGIIIIAAAGGYLYGRQEGVHISEREISKYEDKIKSMQTSLNLANAKSDMKVVTKYIHNTKTVEKIVYVNREVIKNKIVPTQFMLSKGFIHTYNATIYGKEVDVALASDQTPSGVYDSEALDYLLTNVGICHANAVKLTSLQEWVNETNKNIQSVQNGEPTE